MQVVDCQYRHFVLNNSRAIDCHSKYSVISNSGVTECQFEYSLITNQQFIYSILTFIHCRLGKYHKGNFFLFQSRCSFYLLHRLHCHTRKVCSHIDVHFG
jgi:hypothetical protein